MKNLVNIILIITFISCSSPNKVIENFLIEEQKEMKNKNFVLVKEKRTLTDALTCFAPRIAFDKTGEKLKWHNGIKNKYDNLKIENWGKKDFPNIDFEIVPSDSLILYKKNIGAKADKSDLFFISNPFFYKERGEQYVFFDYVPCKSFSCSITNVEVTIILKKIKGKWVEVERLPTSNL